MVYIKDSESLALWSTRPLIMQSEVARGAVASARPTVDDWMVKPVESQAAEPVGSKRLQHPFMDCPLRC